MTQDTGTRTSDEEMAVGATPVAVDVKNEERPIARRFALRAGIAAAVAAAVAGIAGGRKPEAAEAVTGGGGDGLFVNGSNFGNTPNSATVLTVLTTASGFADLALADFECNNGHGTNINAVYGSGKGTGAGVIGECGGAIGDNTDTLQNVGVWGNSLNGSDGVLGTTNIGTGSAGVRGVSTATGGNGVIGIANAGGAAFGVFGKSTTGTAVVASGGPTGMNAFGTNIGVVGTAPGGGTAGVEGVSGGTYPGVLGLVDGTSPPVNVPAGVLGRAAANTGVLGINTGTGGFAGVEGDGNTLGVQGVSQTSGNTTGYGVKGVALNGTGSAGVLGTSTTGYGFYGSSTAAGTASFVPAGILGFTSQSTGAGLITYNGAGAGFAAIFGSGAIPHSGNVLIEGTLMTLNSAPTTGARDASGTLRRLYGTQSTESVFEDFGSGQLNNGSATVQLDSTFASLVDTSDYHVFLTPEGQPSGPLYVSNKTSGGFTVNESGGGDSAAAGGKPGAGGGSNTLNFSYRVVAKAKTSAGARLETIAEPPAVSAPAIAPSNIAASPAALAASVSSAATDDAAAIAAKLAAPDPSIAGPTSGGPESGAGR